MQILHATATLIGWVVLGLWTLGALGLCDVVLRVGPPKGPSEVVCDHCKQPCTTSEGRGDES